MKKKSQISLLMLGLFITLGMVVGISYAIWQITLEQSGSNIITSDCFRIEFSDLNSIHLDKASPITNKEGDALIPYEFTITNTCNTRANYQINLEILNDTTFMRLEYIREKLNEKGVSSGSRILTRNTLVEKTLENAKEAYKLNQGVLEASESKSYELRFWMDKSTPAIEEVMNKTLNAKITVITSLKPSVDTTNMMVAMGAAKSCSGLWCIPSKNTTYTQGEKYENTLKKVLFESVKNPIEGALEVKDFSVNQDESVLGYYVGNEDNTEVTLHIQANGKIKVNENGSSYFYAGGTPTYTFEGFENLDTSEVTNMANMFWGMRSLTSLDLSNFDTSNVTDMSNMFAGMSNLTSLDVSSFDTSNVINMGGMFWAMSSVTSLDLSNFETSNVTDMRGMFDGMNRLTSLDLSNFDTSNVTDMSYMFGGMNRLTSLDVSFFDTSSVTNMRYMFYEVGHLTSLDVTHFDTSNVTDMGYMFYYCRFLENLDLSSFDTSNVTDMSYMFYECAYLTSLDLSSFDTSNVTNMSKMFSGCEYLTSLDLSSFDTSNVTNMSNMFYECFHLTSLDLRNFDTSNVTDMNNMFYRCEHLTSLDLSFDTSNVTDMSRMFYQCVLLTSLNLSTFDTSNVTNMDAMFAATKSLVNITYGDKFIRKSESIITSMFSGCPANKPTHSSWEGAF